MDDQLDDSLKRRIREVFDNFEDTSADEGWLRLREKYPEKHKRRVAAWVWWAPAAALLLLFIGLLWFKNTPANHQPVAATKKPQVKGSGTDTAGAYARTGINGSANAGLNEQVVANNNAPAARARVSTYLKMTNTVKSAQGGDRAGINNTPATQTIIKTPGDELTATDQAEEKPQPINTMASVKRPDSTRKTNGNTLAAAPERSGVDMMQQTSKEHNPALQNTFAQNKPVEKSLNTGSRIRLGVYAATYVNYAKGSNSQVNEGAGISSDIRLSKRFSLSTGIAVGQNSLNYSNQPPVSSAPVPEIAKTAAPAASLYSLANTYHIAAPTFKSYNADLVGLDVPVNLKYTFNPQKSDTYIMAGFSSGTFINETYTYSYNNPALFSANVSTVQDQSTHNSFGSFYFAKMLNLSFGTGYSLGRNRLIVEPFLKYPIEGLGAQQIRFGSGGVNLKFSFPAVK
ncbi:MAG: outer membrane beta-barrel protein [Bacteroidetes bacterium]|nr:outer membrane beta-barrel protein [Bacteroidota bacterium]